MNLTVKRRDAEKKREAMRIRRDGDIPAVVYSQGKPGEKVTISGPEFLKLLRSIPKGTLSATVLTLVDADGKKRKVIVKDIQYHRTTYQIEHLDFEELHDGVMVNVKIPIICIGDMDCAGIKLGGVLRQVIRYLPVRCTPEHIPGSLEMNVQPLQVGQSLRLSDLKIPADVMPRTNLDTVAVTIAKR